VVKGNLAGEGLARLSYTEGLLRICATATPWGKGGRIDSLFGTLHWLWPDEYPSKWAWARRHFEVITDQVFIKGGRGATKSVTRIGGLLKEGGEKELYDSLGPRVLRRTMAEVSPAHAGLKNYFEVTCELDGPQAKQYKTFTDNAEVPVQGGIVTTTGTLDFMTRCRQIANGVIRLDGQTVKYTGASVKIEALMEHLETVGIADGSSRTKVVVASQYNEFLDVVGARLTKEGIAFHRMDGGTTEPQRDRMMDEFQGEPRFGTGRTRTRAGTVLQCPGCDAEWNTNHRQGCPEVPLGPQVFLMNAKAGGVSITLDAADEMHQLDEMYPPESNEQLHWRIFRRSRVHQVFYYMYRAEGTIDEKIGFNVAEGTKAQLKVLDGRRGIDVVRRLAKYQPAETG
jgi:SNF2 family DNA or RNA helicase